MIKRLFTDKPQTTKPQKEEVPVEWWRSGYGDYQPYKLLSSRVFGALEHPAATVEGFLAFAIEYQLREREARADKDESPVIILDFGATQGHSLVRLGERFAKDIQAGNLILVGTNLRHQPNKAFEEQYFDGYVVGSLAQANEQRTSGYYAKVANVVWLNARAHQLPSMSVQDKQGRTWPLRNHVAVIHEHEVFQHIAKDRHSPGLLGWQKEQLAAWSLRALLSPRGVMVSRDLPANFSMHGDKSAFFDRQMLVKKSGHEMVQAYQQTVLKQVVPELRTRLSEWQQGKITKAAVQRLQKAIAVIAGWE